MESHYCEPCLLRTFRYYEAESWSLGIFPANRALGVTTKSRYCEHLAITNPAYYELFAITKQKAGPLEHSLQTEPWVLRRNLAIANISLLRTLLITNFSPLRSRKLVLWNIPCKQSPGCYDEISLLRTSHYCEPCLLRTFHFFELRGWSQQNTSCITNLRYNEFPLLRTCLSLQLVKAKFHRALKAKMFLEKIHALFLKSHKDVQRFSGIRRMSAEGKAMV